jgi:hypothetical protein
MSTFFTSYNDFLTWFNDLEPRPKRDFIKHNKFTIDDINSKKGFRNSTKKELLEDIEMKYRHFKNDNSLTFKFKLDITNYRVNP